MRLLNKENGTAANAYHVEVSYRYIQSEVNSLYSQICRHQRTDESIGTFKDFFSALLHACKNMEFVITDTNGFEQAQVCAGGIRLTKFLAIQWNLSVRICILPEELLDVDGICGGYNLQWAWASGYLAGTAAGRLE